MPFRTVSSFQTFTASATAADPVFPITYISSYPYSPFRPWKSSSLAGQVDVTLDFGSGQTLASLVNSPAIFIDNTNIASLLVQGNTVTTSWGAPPWQAGVGVQTELYGGQRRLAVQLSDLSAAAFSYRYLNLRINSQAPSSGTQYQIGTILIGGVQNLVADPVYPAVRERIDPIASIDYPDGGREVLSLGQARVKLNFQTDAVGSAELAGLLAIDKLGRHRPFLFWDATTSGTADAWLVRRADSRPWTERFLTQYEGPWTLEEVV